MDPIEVKILSMTGEPAVMINYPNDPKSIKKGLLRWLNLGRHVPQPGAHAIPPPTQDRLNSVRGAAIGKYRTRLLECCAKEESEAILQAANTSSEEIFNIINLQYSHASIICQSANSEADPFASVDTAGLKSDSSDFKQQAQTLLALANDLDESTDQLTDMVKVTSNKRQKLMTAIDEMKSPAK